MQGAKTQMRAMGLDVGTKTVGVAISDELGITAQPITTVRRKGLAADLNELATLQSEYSVDQIVVGLPLNMNGTEGPRALASRAFGEALEKKLKLPTIYWDERLTTVSAQRSLIESNVSREKRKEVIDQVAAVLILQSWLDSRSPLEADDE
jgi:putative holliday junction resolvase